MTLEQIKKAVDEGKTVHWSNSGYTVIKDKLGQYLIGWNIGGHDENYVGLTEEYMAPAHNKFFIPVQPEAWFLGDKFDTFK